MVRGFAMQMEAPAGIEPAYTDLQSAASPLRHRASTRRLGSEHPATATCRSPARYSVFASVVLPASPAVYRHFRAPASRTVTPYWHAAMERRSEPRISRPVYRFDRTTVALAASGALPDPPALAKRQWQQATSGTGTSPRESPWTSKPRARP